MDLSYQPDARMSISNIRIFDESHDPVKRIVNIGSLELIIDKEKITNKIIDVEKAEALDVVYFGANIDERLNEDVFLYKI